MSEEKRLAVLIDSDNVSAKYAQFVMNEVQKYGIPTYKRVYGDWEKGGNGWHNPAINYSIMPVQQCSYIAGKNATDFSMIIDAMDILYSGNVDGFVLVTSDSDFTRLAIRLREAGKLVVGIGELKTPRAFTVSCHHFCYLNQIGEMEGTQDEASIRKAVLTFVTENQGERLDLARIFAVLTSKFGNINFDELGYKRFSNFIDSFPELRRSNTFVSLRKKREEKPAPVVQKPEEVTVQAISDAMSEYLKEHEPEQDNMLKIESYLNSRFGKIDFAKFGSSRFARFIDKLPQFNRTGTLVTPAEVKPAMELSAESYRREVITYASDNMPDGGNIGQLNNHLMGVFGKDYFKALGFGDFKAALNSVGEVRPDGNRVYLAEGAPEPEKPKGLPAPDFNAVTARIIQYAAENMPDGGNIGQLNNELIGAYGKDYFRALGFADFRALLMAVPEVRVSKNRAYTVLPEVVDAPAAEVSEEVKAVAEVIAEVNSDEAADVTEEKAEAEIPENGGKKDKSRRNRRKKPAVENENEQVVEDKPGEGAEEVLNGEAAAESGGNAESSEGADGAADPGQEKPELNAIKRDILQFVAASENGGSLSRLGGMLGTKYGRDFLKQLGFASMRKLAAEVTGTVVKNNKLYISDEFAQQTEEIERFVNEFAHGEGSRSIRALGIQLKERFEGFDFRNYGFARFTDFINAIDGVKADRYHVRPDD
ncbi:MAG: NYN domain-containing protein [Oscillospiraceae bacterium]